MRSFDFAPDSLAKLADIVKQPFGSSAAMLSLLSPQREGDLFRWFTQLFNQTSDAVFVVGPDFRIVWWGPRAERMLGVPVARALGRHCFELLAGRHAAGRAECGPRCWVMRAARRGRTVPAFGLDLRTGKGERRSYTVGFMRTDADGLLIHVLRQQDLPTLEPVPPADQAPSADERARVERVHWLTSREREVLLLIMAGATAPDIAQRLSISPATARNHVQNVLAKLGVHSRLEAAIVALQAGLEPPSSDTLQ
ncbi:MAG: PAS domain-containing protein [Chloroflexi bacterium]|nr:PAS domain-containing protein [Chloroflexota bacterium]